ncbi:FAD-dependent oxidoreductase [bacterium]|jgi:glycine oxidase|nr:FAD-dependent oxidoreductase [bacterium]
MKELFSGQFDVIVIGQGLAGSMLAFHLKKMGAKVLIFDSSHEKSSSIVSAGLIDPLFGSRLRSVFDFDNAFSYASQLYRELELLLDCSFFNPIFSKRYIFTPLNNKQVKKVSPFLVNKERSIDDFKLRDTFESSYLSLETGSSSLLNVSLLLKKLRIYFEESDQIESKKVSEKELSGLLNDLGRDGYSSIGKSKLVFCDGWQSVSNPFFSWLPWFCTFGELMKFRFKNDPGLSREHIHFFNQWLVPSGENEWIFGSNYIPISSLGDLKKDGPNICTEGVDFIYKKWANDVIEKGIRGESIKTEYLLDIDVDSIKSGVRPTLKDAKPVMGPHPKFSNIWTFNGLASKGSLYAPLLAKQCSDSILNGSSICEKFDIARFK